MAFALISSCEVLCIYFSSLLTSLLEISLGFRALATFDLIWLNLLFSDSGFVGLLFVLFGLMFTEIGLSWYVLRLKLSLFSTVLTTGSYWFSISSSIELLSEVKFGTFNLNGMCWTSCIFLGSSSGSIMFPSIFILDVDLYEQTTFRNYAIINTGAFKKLLLWNIQFVIIV